MKNNILNGIVSIAMLVLFSGCYMTRGNAGRNTMQTRDKTNKAEQTQETSLEDSRPDSSMEGGQLKAFLVAYAAFQKESTIPVSKRRVENYNIEFRHDDKSYVILFDPKSTNNDDQLVGGETDLGVEVSYTINKADFKLVDRKFYK